MAWRYAFLLAFFCLNASATELPWVMLDPGHSPQQPGATSISGKREVDYNDRFAARLAELLRKEGIPVRLTREPAANLGLADRAAMANRDNPALFLSIHHDSAQLQFLKPSPAGGFQTTRPIAGYSLFVSAESPAYTESLRFANQLAHGLLQLGRTPSLHHAEPIAGENRELIDRTLGIYRFDDLAVLRKNRPPSVLLEVGVIVDAADEQYVSDAGNQDAMCQAIVRAIKTFLALKVLPTTAP